jgi:hypothetical protein
VRVRSHPLSTALATNEEVSTAGPEQTSGVRRLLAVVCHSCCRIVRKHLGARPFGYSDGLRDSVREVLRQASGGSSADVDMGLLRAGLHRPPGVCDAWRVYNCIENHDLVLAAGEGHGHPRIPQLDRRPPGQHAGRLRRAHPGAGTSSLELQILRQAGALYQFRHGRLRGPAHRLTAGAGSRPP